jgi:hypothetical protein
MNTSSGGFLVGGSGLVYGVVPRVFVHRPVRYVVRTRPMVRHNIRQVFYCALCSRYDGVRDFSHTSRTCPYH